MQVKATLFGLVILAVALIASILSSGLLLPFMLPVGMYGLKMLGVPLE